MIFFAKPEIKNNNSVENIRFEYLFPVRVILFRTVLVGGRNIPATDEIRLGLIVHKICAESFNGVLDHWTAGESKN
jgi:hypothetical protein